MASKTNCVINGKSYYRIRRKVGMKLDKKGEWVPDMKPFYGDGKKDAERQYQDFLAKKQQGIKIDDSTLGQLAEYYTYNVLIHSSKLGKSTISRYEIVYRNAITVCPLFTIPLSEINSMDIQTYYNALKASGKSQSYITHVNKYLSHFFKYAETDGYCKNPLGNVVVPQDEAKELSEPVVFSDDEINVLVQECKIHQYGFLFLLGLTSGLRKGELLGLTYGDIRDDFVYVNKQLTDVYSIKSKTEKTKQRMSQKTKTSNSIRNVPLPEYTLNEFKRYCECRPHKDSDLIFASSSGNNVNLGNLKRSFDRLQLKIYKNTIKNLSESDQEKCIENFKAKDFHALRRTYCTMLCKSGVPLQVAYKLMGHHDISVTAKYYTFISDDEKKSAAASVQKMFKDF